MENWNSKEKFGRGICYACKADRKTRFWAIRKLFNLSHDSRLRLIFKTRFYPRQPSRYQFPSTPTLWDRFPIHWLRPFHFLWAHEKSPKSIYQREKESPFQDDISLSGREDLLEKVGISFGSNREDENESTNKSNLPCDQYVERRRVCHRRRAIIPHH